MPFFPLTAFQHWVLAFFLGLAAVVLTCMALGAKTHKSKRTEVHDTEKLLSETGSHLNLLSQYKTNPHGLSCS